MTYEAVYDIVDAEEYIRWRFGENRAFEYRRDIYNELAALKTDYNNYGTAGCIYRGYRIYRKPFSPAIIFWVVKKDGVHVLRIPREEFNWQLFLICIRIMNICIPMSYLFSKAVKQSIKAIGCFVSSDIDTGRNKVLLFKGKEKN